MARSNDRLNELKANWLLILGSFFGIMLGIASLPFYILGPLVGAMQAEFGWSPKVLFLCPSLLSLGVTIGSPFVGKLADRIAPRTLALTSLAALAACPGIA